MKTVNNIYNFTTEVNRSKFITYIVPIDEYKELQQRLKDEHPKASHIVYALRYLNEFDQIVENSSDDGEPKGAAGVPSLNVLRGEEMINCATLTVRYFGGVKLGVGGMARAYALSIKNLLKDIELLEYVKEIDYKFTTSYSDIEKSLYRLKQLGITTYQRNFGIDRVEWIISCSKEKIESFKLRS